MTTVAAGVPARRRRADWTLLAIVAGALLVRLVVLAQLGSHALLQPRGLLDDAVYVKLASRVAAGDLALGPEVYYLSPFYTYFLGLVFSLTGGSVSAARLLQVLLGAAAAGLVTLTARAWFGNRAGVIAGALTALTGIIVFNEILVLQSSVDPFLTALALYAVTRAVGSSNWSWFGAAGLVFGALVLNRPNALLVLPAIAAVWLLARRSRQAFVQVAALAVGAMLLMGPVALRNRVVAGEWVLISSHGGLNFYIGNSAKADGTWQSVPGLRPSIEGQREDVRRVAGEALGRPVTAGEASDYFYSEARKWIAENPGAWVQLLARKLALSFNRADAALNYSYTYFARDEASLLSVLVVGPWLIVPLGLFGLLVRARERDRAGYFAWAVFVPVYAATLVVFFVSSRYRLPLLVPLLVGAGGAVSWLWSRVADRRTVPAAIGVSALALLAVFANWPLEVDDRRLFQREEQVVRLITDGRIEEGKRLLAETEPVHANRAVMLYRAGLAFRQRGLPGEAIACFERSLAANPDQAWIRFNLGRALVDVGRYREAIPYLQEASRASIEPAITEYHLARAYRAAGEMDRARETLAGMPLPSSLGARTLIEFGLAALDLQDPVQAERFFRDAVTREPSTASAHQHLGRVLGLQGKKPEAVQAFETAVRLDPASAEGRLMLGVAYAEIGQYDAARAQAEQALRLQPTFQPAQMLLSKLPPR